MANILKSIETLQSMYDFYGTAKDVYDTVDQVKQATEIDPKNIKKLKALFGTGELEQEVRKLAKHLDQNTKATLSASKAAFPPIKTDKDKLLRQMWDQVMKFGYEHKTTQAARKRYINALVKYQKQLQARSRLCKLTLKVASTQIKTHKQLSAYAGKVQRAARNFAELPGFQGSSYQASAFQLSEAFVALPPAAERLYKAQTRLARTLSAELDRVQSEMETVDCYIREFRKTDLTRWIRDVMKSLGFKLPAKA